MMFPLHERDKFVIKCYYLKHIIVCSKCIFQQHWTVLHTPVAFSLQISLSSKFSLKPPQKKKKMVGQKNNNPSFGKRQLLTTYLISGQWTRYCPF